MNNLDTSIDVSIKLKDLANAMLSDLIVSEIVDFMSELDLMMDDWELTNEIYEHFRQRHIEYLDTMGITEQKYRNEFADPTYYPFDEDGTEEDIEEEPWTTSDIKPEEEIKEGSLILGDEEDVDVFSTESGG